VLGVRTVQTFSLSPLIFALKHYFPFAPRNLIGNITTTYLNYYTGDKEKVKMGLKNISQQNKTYQIPFFKNIQQL